MLARLFPVFDLPADWQPWLAPVIGLTSAGLTLFMGRTLVSRWRSRSRAASRDTPPPAGMRSERRKSPRRRCPAVKVVISDLDGQTRPHSAVLLDRSVGGMRLGVAEAISVGTVLSIRLDEGSPSASWPQLEVKYCFWQDDCWLVGCRFVGTPSWSVLMLFD
jgi:hypothetical protein